MQYDIFISYKRKSASSMTASYLYDLLIGRGYNVFLDRKEMRPGKFNEQLLEHIANAKDILILLEEESLCSWFSEKEKLDEKNVDWGKPLYKSDWFCKEIMHALSFEGKTIIPLLVDGYKMPEEKDLPIEMKSLASLQALPIDSSEVKEFYQKYIIEKNYLKSKPQNLAMYRQYDSKGPVQGCFLFYTEAENCDLYECGEKIITLTDNNDEDHPFRYPVPFAGEHRFTVFNNETCEEIHISQHIDPNSQVYVPVKWNLTQSVWNLTEEDIAQQDNVNMLYCWGDWLFNGDAKHERNVHLALLCFEKTVKMEHTASMEYVQAHTNIGFSELQSNPVDWFRWLNMSAALGNETAFVLIGKMYEDGLGVEQDYEKAMEWFQKAEEKGNVDSTRMIGNMYYYGCGVEKDYLKAKEYYIKAAEKGDGTSMCIIGNMFLEGLGVEQDYEKAMEWYRKAAEIGMGYALSQIGMMYRNGLGVEQDDLKVIEYYEKAIPYLDEIFNIAVCHYYIGITYDALDDVDSAKEHFNEIIKILPAEHEMVIDVKNRLEELKKR